jgi:hypothetical protein
MASFDNVPVSLFLSDARTEVLPIHLWQIIETSLDVRAAAASGVLILLTLALVLVADRVGGLTRHLRLGVGRLAVTVGTAVLLPTSPARTPRTSRPRHRPRLSAPRLDGAHRSGPPSPDRRDQVAGPLTLRVRPSARQLVGPTPNLNRNAADS